MRCYVFIQTTKLHIFSIYGNFLLFIFYFLKDMRTEEHVLSLNQRTCSSVLLSYPSQAIPMFFCSPVLPLANNPHVLLFSCLTPRKQSPCSSVLLSYPRKQSPCSSILLSYPSQAIPMFSCSSVFPKKHVLLSNYHAHFSYSN